MNNMTAAKGNRLCILLTDPQMAMLKEHAEREDKLTSELAREIIRGALKELRTGDPLSSSETTNQAGQPDVATPIGEEAQATMPIEQPSEKKNSPEKRPLARTTGQ